MNTEKLIDVRCNLCGADHTQLLYPNTLTNVNSKLNLEAYRCTSPTYRQHLQIVRCRECQLVYANPRFDPDTLIDSYEAVEDELYLKEREGRVLTFQKHLKVMQRVLGVPDGRKLLDVGAYVGVFVDVARRAGWDVTGLEPSRWAVAQAQAGGLPVIQGDLQQADFVPESVDVVTVWDVVEHFDDPLREIEAAYRLTRPGGWVVIHTIDIGSPTARLLRARWPFLMEMHVVYFSRATLRELLEKAGYEFVEVHTQGRYLSAGYLANRIGAAFSKPLGNALHSVLKRLKLAEVPLPVNTFDLFTMYARKPLRQGDYV